MPLAFSTNFPVSTFNASFARIPHSHTTTTPSTSPQHFTLSFNLFICTIGDADAVSHQSSRFFPLSFLSFSLFLSFEIPTEWNPLRRGGGCNRLTICYCSDLFLNSSLHFPLQRDRLSHSFPHCRGSWLFVAAVGFEPGCLPCSLVTLRSNRLIRVRSLRTLRLTRQES